mmetsp:Transcript_149734/g.363745  ORF Transcript_149734/g.363745 Transcript_149734/m.363745 type:complete len:200 (-) Transcript_149734:1925-2524(-)
MLLDGRRQLNWRNGIVTRTSPHSCSELSAALTTTTFVIGLASSPLPIRFSPSTTTRRHALLAESLTGWPTHVIIGASYVQALEAPAATPKLPPMRDSMIGMLLEALHVAGGTTKRTVLAPSAAPSDISFMPTSAPVRRVMSMSPTLMPTVLANSHLGSHATLVCATLAGPRLAMVASAIWPPCAGPPEAPVNPVMVGAA